MDQLPHYLMTMGMAVHAILDPMVVTVGVTNTVNNLPIGGTVAFGAALCPNTLIKGVLTWSRTLFAVLDVSESEQRHASKTVNAIDHGLEQTADAGIP